ncbi:hypothetical protein F3J23_14035 [Chryseobacterium sp. Tr-659]|nr:hypothetical protein [Chryseobacterium sp. Tr-659]
MTSCQKDIIADFDIHIESVNPADKRYFDIRKIEIYKNDKIFKIIEPVELAPSLDKNIKLDSIKGGKYSFVYESLFGETIKKEIKVDDSKTYRVSINPDKVSRKIKDLSFGKIKNDEVKLVYKSRGCFHQEEDSLRLINKGNDYFIQVKNGRVKKIDKKIWAFFVNLENQIRQIPENGECTTKDVYIFYAKGKTDTIIDGTCNFSFRSDLEAYLQKNKLQ